MDEWWNTGRAELPCPAGGRGLRAGEGVLDTGADLAVGRVVLFLPGKQFALPALTAVRDDQAGAPVADVSDHGGAADGVLGSGQCPRLAVVAVAGQRPADHDDKPGRASTP